MAVVAVYFEHKFPSMVKTIGQGGAGEQMVGRDMAHRSVSAIEHHHWQYFLPWVKID